MREREREERECERKTETDKHTERKRERRERLRIKTNTDTERLPAIQRPTCTLSERQTDIRTSSGNELKRKRTGKIVRSVYFGV